MAVRFPIAMILGVVAYLIAMAMTVYDGALSLIFQPIVGSILTGIACVALTVLASPLLITRVWNFWRRLWPVPLLLAMAGVVSMAASWHSSLRIQVWDPELHMQVESFHPVLAMGGWAAMLFGILWLPKIALTRDARWA